MKLAVFAASKQYYDLGHGYQDAVRIDTFKNAFLRAKANGVDGLEPAICRPEDLDVDELKRAMAETGMGISMLGTAYWRSELGLELLNPDDKISEKALKMFKQALKIGKEIGAPAGLGALRSGMHDDNRSLAWYTGRLVEICKDIADYCRQIDTFFTIEPQHRLYQNMINNVPEALDVINRVGSDRFKITFDLKQSYIEEDIFVGIAQARGLLHNIHFMDCNHAPAAPGGILDFPAIIKALNAVDFDGWISLTMLNVDEDRIRRQDEHMKVTSSYVRDLIERYCC